MSIGRVSPRGRHSTWWLWNPVAIPSGRSFSCAAVNVAAKAFQPSTSTILPGARDDDRLAADDLVELDGFWQVVGADGCAPLCVDRHLMPRSSSSLRIVLGGLERPVEVGRVELHDLVAHLGDGGHGGLQVLGQLAADRVELDADGDSLRLRQEGRRKRHRTGHGEKRASGKVVVFHAGKVTQIRPRARRGGTWSIRAFSWY